MGYCLKVDKFTSARKLKKSSKIVGSSRYVKTQMIFERFPTSYFYEQGTSENAD